MFIYELAEAAPQQEIRLVVVYPGRFQPFHRGHAGVFAKLQGKFGRNNCFIATTPNVKIDDRNPFNATEKVALMHAAGITNDRIQLITEPYRIEVVTGAIGFDPQNTILIFAVGAPDKDRLEVDQTYTQYTPKPLKDGSRRLSKIPDGKVVGDAKPMKTFPGKLQDCVTVAQGHAYVVVVDEIAVNFEFNGEVRDISHGTQCRNTWNDVRNDPAASKSFLTTLYGRATPELVHIFDKIPPPAGELPGLEPKPTKLPKPAKPAGGIDKIAQQAKKANKLVKEGVGVVKDGNDPAMVKEILSKTRMREEAAGVGVVAGKKQAQDPRYSTSLTKDVRPGQINKSLRAFNLAETDETDRNWARIQHLNSLFDKIKTRLATEKLTPAQVADLKKRREEIEKMRVNVALGRA